MACRSSVRYRAALASAAAAWLARICRSSSSSSPKTSPWEPRISSRPSAAPPEHERDHQALAAGILGQRRSQLVDGAAAQVVQLHRRLLAGGRGRRTGREGDERLAAPQQQRHGDAGDGEQTGDFAADLAEHGADVQRGDQHAARLEQRHEPPVLELAAPVQPRVADGDGGQLTEGARELYFGRSEDPLARRLDEHQEAEPLALHDERDVEAGLLAPLLHGRAHVVGQRRIGERLLDDLPAAQDLAVRGIVVQRVDLADLERGRPLARAVEGAEHDGVAGGVVLVGHALARLERLRRGAADAVQRVFQGHRGGDGARRVQQRRRGSGSAPAAGGTAARCAPPRRRGPRASVTSSPSSSVKRRPCALLDQRQAADDALVAEAQRHRQRRDLAPLDHGGAVGRMRGRGRPGSSACRPRPRGWAGRSDGRPERSSCRPRRGPHPSARAPRGPPR